MTKTKGKDTVGGWMWYAGQVKEQLGREMTELEVKDIFRKYITGVKWDTAILEIQQ